MAGLDLSTAFAKAEMTTFVLTALSLVFNFVALLTPSWHVAEDLDAHRDVQSGLWQYCQGGQSCWYIFSDDLVNYYERADICRFLLIGDCRKKLLRTPYFFGWHYAVLTLMVITVVTTAVCLAGLAFVHLRPRWRKLGHIVIVSLLGTAALLQAIGLAVFMINGEMLESKYLIGIKNTFEKHFGYSFYLAFLGLTLLFFAGFASLFCATYPIFFNTADAASGSNGGVGGVSAAYRADPTAQYVLDQYGRPISRAEYNYNLAKQEAHNQQQLQQARQAHYAPSEVSAGGTRTFISY